MTVEPATMWEVRDISKAFPGVQALDQVSLTLMAGEIHALVGENGSGKSTLVKCLAGVHQPDGGEIRLGGKTVTMPNPIAARQRGVATIYQELSLVPTLTVAENIFLGRFPTVLAAPDRRLGDDAPGIRPHAGGPGHRDRPRRRGQEPSPWPSSN